jgi:acetyl esterase/lipase
MKTKLLLILLLLTQTLLFGQDTMPLYDGKIPNNKSDVIADYSTEKLEIRKDGLHIINNITKPSLTIFKPPKPNGKAVIICPGGGYYILASSHEGSDVAKKLNEFGVTAFVLKYRLPTSGIMENNEIGPLMDVQEAIRKVRRNAKMYGVDPEKIGVMGFSAGGHLASSAATHFEKPILKDETSAKPNFCILGYPVISFDPKIYHKGSAEALLGKNASQDKIDLYSNEKQVNALTPPTFLVHAVNDAGVPVENSIEFMLACKKHKVPVEVHIYPEGGHGFGMNNPTTDDQWMDRLKNWLEKLK